MDPNNQQQYQPQQQVYSIDYLDQIAPKRPGTSKRKKILLAVGGGVLVLLIVLVASLIIASGPKSASQTALDLQIRLDTLRDVSKDQHSNLRDNNLRNHNSSLTLLLTNASTDLAVALESEGIKDTDRKVKAKREAAQEAIAEQLSAEFEDANLNMQLDRIYAREMSYQLDVIGSIMTSIADRTSSPLMKEFVASNLENFQGISQTLTEFSGAK